MADPLEGFWEDDLLPLLDKDSALQAVTLLRHLQSKHPLAFPDDRIRRTLERRVRQWRSLKGPERDIIFRQTPEPGYMAQSDFTHAEELDVTIAGQAFPHLLYHFVMAYSRWEHVGVVLGGESFKALAENFTNVASSMFEVLQERQDKESLERLAEVLVNEGDRVSKDQLLARLDTRTLEASRTQAEAEVLRAKQTLAAAEANVQLRLSEHHLAGQELKRTTELFRRNYASRQLLDQQQSRLETSDAAVNAAQAQVGALQAAIGAAEAQVAQLTSEIDDSSLRAPIDGVIQLRLAEPGEVLGAGGRVLLLINPDEQYMNLYLSAAVAGRLTQGDEARVLLDALPERPLPARIAYVAAKAQFTPKEVETRDERQKLVFRVKLRLSEPAAVPQAKPGMPGVGYVRSAEVAWPAELQ